MLNLWLGVIVFFNVSPTDLTCNDTFKNTVVNALTVNGTRLKVTVNGCIERKAFGGQTIAEVDVDGQSVPILRADAIKHLLRLRKITISNNDLARVEQNAFRNIPKLATIEFIYTRLSELYNGMFNNVEGAEEISLHHNQIASIEDDVFSDMAQLKKVNLSYNKLEEIRGSWYLRMTSLTSVDYRHNLIRTIPRKVFANLPNLTYICLDHNEIASIQANAFDGLARVEYLGLQHNRLRAVDPRAFPQAISVETLRLDANKLLFLSDKILRKVRNVGIFGNPLKCPCIEKISQTVFAQEGMIVQSEECLNVNIPVCVDPKTPTTICDETQDEELRGTFYRNVDQYRSNEEGLCVQFS